MINRNKLEHILEYAKQQRHIGQSCKVPPEDMVEIMERLLSACNPPAQSDCCPAQNHVSPEQNGYTPAQSQGWIPVSEQNPDCWCLTCRPVTLNDMRFVVCPDCGNKRCPRANDHRNACTRSNEPGQEGSAYPAAPQEVRGE